MWVGTLTLAIFSSRTISYKASAKYKSRNENRKLYNRLGGKPRQREILSTRDYWKPIKLHLHFTASKNIDQNGSYGRFVVVVLPWLGLASKGLKTVHIITN